MKVKRAKPGEKLPRGEYAYITARGGHYLYKNIGLFEACVQVDEAPDLPEQEEFFVLHAPKIPLALIAQVLAFFESVYRKHKSEAIALFTYDKEWGVYIPRQDVSSAHLAYENSDKARVVGSIHSHPGFGAHPSGTDEHDEVDFDGVHLIANGFVPVAPALGAFVVVNGRRFRIRPEVVIEGIELPQVAVPEEWMGKVSERRSSHEPETLFDGKDEKRVTGEKNTGEEEMEEAPWWDKEGF